MLGSEDSILSGLLELVVPFKIDLLQSEVVNLFLVVLP